MTSAQSTTSSAVWLDALATALGPVIWGSTYIVTTELLPPDRPFTAALLRTLPAGLLLVLWCRRWPASGDWVGWWRLMVLAALNIGVFQALLFVAAYRLPGGVAAVVGAVGPLVVMGLTWALDHRRQHHAACQQLPAGKRQHRQVRPPAPRPERARSHAQRAHQRGSHAHHVPARTG